MEEQLRKEGLDGVSDYHTWFEIDFQRDGIPVYFFQKSEIEAAMRAADDRHYNQLVVDEEGSIRILSNHENGLLYPVQLEGWNAGNNYVGKYSKLSTLEENYRCCLYGWLQYLKTGKAQYVDYLPEKTEEDVLISEIKDFYLDCDAQ